MGVKMTYSLARLLAPWISIKTRTLNESKSYEARLKVIVRKSDRLFFLRYTRVSWNEWDKRDGCGTLRFTETSGYELHWRTSKIGCDSCTGTLSGTDSYKLNNLVLLLCYLVAAVYTNGTRLSIFCHGYLIMNLKVWRKHLRPSLRSKMLKHGIQILESPF